MVCPTPLSTHRAVRSALGLVALSVGLSALPAFGQQAYFRGEAKPGENVIVNLSVIDKLTGADTRSLPAPSLAAPLGGDTVGLSPPPSSAPRSTLLATPDSSAGTPAAPPKPVPVPTAPTPTPKPVAPPPAPAIAAAPAPPPAPKPVPASPAPTPALPPAQRDVPKSAPEVSAPPPAPEGPEGPATAEGGQTASVDLTGFDKSGALPIDGGLRVLFEKDSQDLPAAAEAPLRDLAQRLKSDESLTLKLLGYSEPAGAAQSKPRRLSLFRALAVRSFLMQEGIGSRRMTVRALGAKMGAKTGNAPDRPMNRVDLIVSQG